MRDYEKMSDRELLAAILEGDEAALAEYTRRYRDQITNYIYRMLDDYGRTVDLAQKTFVRVWLDVEQAQAQHVFSTFVYKIAHILAVEELRRRKRRKK